MLAVLKCAHKDLRQTLPTFKHSLWGSAETNGWRLLGQDSARNLLVAPARPYVGRYLGVPTKTTTDTQGLRWRAFKHSPWGSAETTDWRLLEQDSTRILLVAQVIPYAGGT